MELTVDTSTSLTGIALAERGLTIAESTWPSARNQTVELLPEVSRMLRKANLKVSSLTGIVVARGPGGFSGLRVGLAFAKGLAFSLGIPIAGVSTLAAIAWDRAEPGIHVRPILPAGRGEIYTALYQTGEGRLDLIEPERISTIDDLCASTSTVTVFSGEITPEQSCVLASALKELAIIPEGPADPARIASMAWLGWCRIESGDTDDAATLQPTYLRKPSITRPGRR